MRKLPAATLVLILVALAVTACAGPTTAPTSPSPSPSIDAAKLYATNCAACHGAKRQGVSRLGPPLDPAEHAHHSEAELRDIIAKGRPGTPMAGFQGRLTPAEIEALASFLRTPVQ